MSTDSTLQGEFERPILQFEREFGMHRNWWVRDPRIVGLPVSILLYVLSHQQQFRVTQDLVRRRLNVNDKAFLKARRTLEATGFLKAVEYRLPAGTVDEHGNKVGGHRRVRFVVMDPPEPLELSAGSDSAAAPTSELGEDACGQPNTQIGAWVDGDDKRPVDNSVLPRNDADQASTQNPGLGFGSLKEDQVNPENQPVNHHPDQTISPVESGGPALPGPVVVFDPVTDAVLAGITPPVDAIRLRDKLLAGQANLAAVNIAAAAVEVLAAPPLDLRDAVAYLAGPILRSPERWPRIMTAPAAAPTRCEAEGHKVFADGTNLCAKCEQVQAGAAARPGARFERGFIHLPATAVSA